MRRLRVKGPLISIRCGCGTTTSVLYPEVWTCERCRTRWDTGQIPADEYLPILREIRHLRRVALATTMAIAGTFVALALFVSPILFVMLPIALSVWGFAYMPSRRRKLQQRAENLPKWELRAG
jgi:hypothetical protein